MSKRLIFICILCIFIGAVWPGFLFAQTLRYNNLGIKDGLSSAQVTDDTSLGHYALNESDGKWKKLEWFSQVNLQTYVLDISPIDSNRFIYSTTDWVTIIDFKARKATFSFFTHFDENEGFYANGFRPNSAYLAGNGIFYWGSLSGINYFAPLQLQSRPGRSQMDVQQVAINNKPYYVTDTLPIRLSYKQNNLSFQIVVIDLLGSKNISYQYQPEGADHYWKTGFNARLVEYNTLAPGQYRFCARASKDGVNWVTASQDTVLIISPPFWKRPWFVFCATACALVLLAGWQWRRERLIEKRNSIKLYQQQLIAENLQYKLETEQVVNFFSISLASKHSVEEALWAVTRNCIARLKFEDCVIYLLDKERQMLVQKAAWGAKATDNFQIVAPIEIPMGKGIVGTAALTAKPVLVPDTSLDPRYIVDNQSRASELAVPIILIGQVIGVIDSEHSQPHFYKQWHVQIVTAIASLCANKIQLARIEETQRKTKLTLLENQRKAEEAKLQSMRLQMSPHFLFDALNSIQQMIITGNESSATLYLSKFSKLLRLILTYSGKEFVTLQEEIAMLALYIELEALRFDESFSFRVSYDESIDLEYSKVPTLLIQPFVENAIWHGLLHKEGERNLQVFFSQEKEDAIRCTIEDNGIGRKAAESYAKHSLPYEAHTGKGVSVAVQRLEVFNHQYGGNSQVNIIDLQDVEGNATGTKIIIDLPTLN